MYRNIITLSYRVEGIEDVAQRTSPEGHRREGQGQKRATGAQEERKGGGKGRAQSHKRQREMTEEDRAMQKAIEESKRTAAATRREEVPHWNKLRERVERDGWKIVDVQGDGSCFFHAIARQAESMGERIQHRELRESVCAFFQEQKEKLEAFVVGDWDMFMQKLQRDSYAEDVVIRAAATVLKTEVVSFVRPKILRPLVGQSREGRVFRIGQLDIAGREHFVSVEAE